MLINARYVHICIILRFIILLSFKYRAMGFVICFFFFYYGTIDHLLSKPKIIFLTLVQNLKYQNTISLYLKY